MKSTLPITIGFCTGILVACILITHHYTFIKGDNYVWRCNHWNGSVEPLNGSEPSTNTTK